MQPDQSQGDSVTKPNVHEERGGFRVPTGRQIIEFTGGDGEDNNITISELMRASSSEKGSQSSLRSAGKSGGTEISPPMFITDRRKTTTETSPTPFIGKGSGQGSTQRKRSRLSAEERTSKTTEKGQSPFGQSTKVEEYLRQLQSVFDHIVTNGEKTLAIRYSAVEALKNINLEYAVCLSTINNLSNKLLNVQDERNALQQQVVELQARVLQHTSTGLSNEGMVTSSYLSAAMRGAASEIQEGKRLPLPSVPINLKHSPAEKIIIFRAKEKGEPVGKVEHENFRENMKTVLGPVQVQSVEVIRPTRHGGHTVIFSYEEERNMAMTKLRHHEEGKGFMEKESCMVAPKKQKAKAVCRKPPENATPDEFLQELYNRTNAQLYSVPVSKRK